MSASSAASSSLTRARTSILALSVLAAASGIYYIYISQKEEEETVNPSVGLHRSNAVHRRQRRERRNAAVPTDPAHVASTDTSEEIEEDNQIVARQLTDGETIVDDQAYQEDYSFAEPQMYTRSGQNIVQLLFRVSEDATRRNAYVHRGCQCNACSMVPIRGIRYRCANCADFDLCEGCEAQGLHNKTHIFYKVKIPAPSFGPRNIQPVWYTGDPETTAKLLPKALLNKLSRETGFERPELDAYWEQWTFMANTDWRDDPDDINLAMDRKTFERCLVPSGGAKHAPPSLIFDRMFAFYDTNKDDLISFPEFLHGLAYRKKKGKWQKIFEGYDIDNDGYVDRKDFLRMFRSYYVLYRQMHRDMLEGMDEQQMSSVDAHRLVSSRQPLSGAFGQDGRYPPAPENRIREGKMIQANGDLEISDGKGIINESGDDTGNREDVFRRPVRNPWDSSRSRRSGGFWDVMLNPPATVEQMGDVLRNLNRVRDSVENVLNANPNAHPILRMAQQQAENGDESSGESDDGSVENDENWPPNFVTVTDEDAEAVAGPGSRVADLGGENRTAATSYAIQRERVQREINERWKRRQFYTDEEEGGTPPADWNEDDDILAQVANGESSKGPSRPSVHSRSSSKVRFAEEVDDFDTRSNPSTSSRSVPERWGGMEIPDAEKDAGKEILYQVTQQAFNELLDSLFKAKEDLALEAAETKVDRERYRKIFDTPWFESWAKSKEAEDEKKEVQPDNSIEQRDQNFPSPLPGFPEVEVEQVSERPMSDISDDRPQNHTLDLTEVVTQVRQRTLSELLDATGYTIEDSVVDVHADAASSLEALHDRGNTLESAHSNSQGSNQSSPEDFPGMPDTVESAANMNSYANPANNSPHLQSTSPSEALSTIAQYDEDSISTPSTIHPTPPSSESSFRDPTLPQFRPSTIESEPKPVNEVPTHNPEAPSKVPSSMQPESSTPQGMFASQRTHSGLNLLSGVVDETTQKLIPKEYLLTLRRADKAEKEKEERGGWGRLNFKEWESMVKKFSKEGKGNQMDYLGSWIEFCIP